MQRRNITVLIVVLIVAASGLVFLMIKNKDNSGNGVKGAATTEPITSEKIGMTVQRDISLTREPLSRDGGAKGELWSLAEPIDSQQEFAIDANYEQGASLKKLTGYTKQSLRDSVVQNINLQLPRQYPGYREITQRNLAINGIEANETIFEYDSSGVKIKQRLMLLFKNSDTAVYIRAQSKSIEYDELNNKYFEPILSSVKFE